MENNIAKLLEIGIFVDEDEDFACEVLTSKILFEQAEKEEMEKLNKMIDDVSMQILKIANDVLENKNKGDN